MQDSISNLLKQLRLQQHMTQAQVAKRLGISRQAYSYYERSSAVPGIELLTQLSELYHLPLHTFCSYLPVEESLLQDASPYSSSSVLHSIRAEFLAFFSIHDNMKKYHYLNRSEKELLFIFQKLPQSEQNELLFYAYFKSTLHTNIQEKPG